MLDNRPWMAVIRLYKTSQVNTEKLQHYRETFEHGSAEYRGLNITITVFSVLIGDEIVRSRFPLYSNVKRTTILTLQDRAS